MTSDGGQAASRRGAPRRQRGRETRAALVAAARKVFERDGFLGARITDIAATASVATGSFYTYFNDKDEIFAALMEETYEQWFDPGILGPGVEEDPVARIEERIRAYLYAYQQNARLRKLMEEVANIDDRFFQVRLRRTLMTTERNAESIRRLQEMGLADPEADPFLASLALGSMATRTAYTAFCGGLPEAVDYEALVTTLTRLWVNGLRIPPGGAP